MLLGFNPPCPDTIRKYMVKPKRGTDKSQTWLTFLRYNMPVSWGMDFCGFRKFWHQFSGYSGTIMVLRQRSFKFKMPGSTGRSIQGNPTTSF